MARTPILVFRFHWSEGKNTQRMYDHDDSKIQSQKVFE
jgi:hypothetical protein